MKEDYYQMSEESYFSLTEEERDNIASKVVKRINEKDTLNFDIQSNFVITILDKEMEYALRDEKYMICDAITRIKEKYNEKTL